MYRLYKHIFIGIVLGISLTISAQAQIQIVHQELSAVEEGRELTIQFSLIGLTPESIDEASVFYRTDGALTYRRVAARFVRDAFEVQIPADQLRGNTFEYYIQIDFPDGASLSYPVNDASGNPIQAPIRTQTGTEIEGTTQRIDYRILSPRPNEAISQSDALIAISFFYPGDVINADGFRLFLNDIDITSVASVSPFLITYVPEEIELGLQTARLIYINGDSETEIISWQFNVVPPGTLPDRFESRQNPFVGDVELTARNQVNAGQQYDFVRGRINVYGSSGKLDYSANGMLTSQESNRLQPQNRYGLHISYSDFARLELGHVYPTINPLLMAGRRILGINAYVATPGHGLQLQVLHGESTRSITPLYTDITEVITERETAGGTILTDTTWQLGLKPDGSGMFGQTISGGRISFGSLQSVQFGINALRVRDNENSIDYFTEFDSFRMQPYLGSLTNEQRSNLQNNPDDLQITRSSTPPISNFVTATDLQMNFDNNRIRLSGDAAVSLLNNDISDGYLSNEIAEDLGYTLPSQAERIFERLSWLIVINENMNALPLRIEDDEAQLRIPRSIFAYQSQLGLSYFGNNANIQYRWIGPDFVSVANNGLRRDIAGYTITDRLRLLDNTVYVNLLYERLEDNLNNQLNATTVSSTYGSTVSWFPLNRSLPRVTVGLRYINRDNNENWTNPFFPGNGRSAAVRNVTTSTVDGEVVYIAAPTPRLQNTIQFNANISRPIDLDYATHDVFVSVNRINTRDQQFVYGDFVNTSLGMGVNSSFVSMPLRASINLNRTKSEGQGGLTNVTITGINASANYQLLDGALTLNAETAILGSSIESTPLRVDDRGTPGNAFDNVYAPDPGSTSREKSTSYVITTGATYRLHDAHQFRISGSYTNVVSRLQMMTIPNDHFLQFRYSYFF
ncbi:MAG: hypothetical protein LAT57_10670 [Balneolales bacterium]|nr:hypothetical protein [Balneolales bacterium]